MIHPITITTYTLSCDRCGKTFTLSGKRRWDTPAELARHSGDYGWVKSGDRDLCPTCKGAIEPIHSVNCG